MAARGAKAVNDGFLFSWGDASARRYFSRWKTSPVTCWGSAAQVVGVLHLMVFFQKKKKKAEDDSRPIGPLLPSRRCAAAHHAEAALLFQTGLETNWL